MNALILALFVIVATAVGGREEKNVNQHAEKTSDFLTKSIHIKRIGMKDVVRRPIEENITDRNLLNSTKHHHKKHITYFSLKSFKKSDGNNAQNLSTKLESPYLTNVTNNTYIIPLAAQEVNISEEFTPKFVEKNTVQPSIKKKHIEEQAWNSLLNLQRLAKTNNNIVLFNLLDKIIKRHDLYLLFYAQKQLKTDINTIIMYSLKKNFEQTTAKDPFNMESEDSVSDPLLNKMKLTEIDKNITSIDSQKNHFIVNLNKSVTLERREKNSSQNTSAYFIPKSIIKNASVYERKYTENPTKHSAFHLDKLNITKNSVISPKKDSPRKSKKFNVIDNLMNENKTNDENPVFDDRVLFGILSTFLGGNIEKLAKNSLKKNTTKKDLYYDRNSNRNDIESNISKEKAILRNPSEKDLLSRKELKGLDIEDVLPFLEGAKKKNENPVLDDRILFGILSSFLGEDIEKFVKNSLINSTTEKTLYTAKKHTKINENNLSNSLKHTIENLFVSKDHLNSLPKSQTKDNSNSLMDLQERNIRKRDLNYHSKTNDKASTNELQSESEKAQYDSFAELYRFVKYLNESLPVQRGGIGKLITSTTATFLANAIKGFLKMSAPFVIKNSYKELVRRKLIGDVGLYILHFFLSAIISGVIEGIIVGLIAVVANVASGVIANIFFSKSTGRMIVRVFKSMVKTYDSKIGIANSIKAFVKSLKKLY